ncbi:hypothetical protein [Neisseria montereyensis]|uniref:Uncharacterized protein n=1 Tax=Neisseria montereyensis TaxID=2973938 RepID=A0ABT2FEI7_9NEIS|nr:hypothetical protein [Neisseria montereyensis]MCS4534624.1 hypothetical protein [Neisseria montereyensis]
MDDNHTPLDIGIEEYIDPININVTKNFNDLTNYPKLKTNYPNQVLYRIQSAQPNRDVNSTNIAIIAIATVVLLAFIALCAHIWFNILH